MRDVVYGVIVVYLLLAARGLRAQSTEPIEQRMAAMAAALTATQQQLEQSQRQLDALRTELEAMKRQGLVAGAPVAVDGSSASVAETVTRQGEEQEVLEAEVKQHEQTKVESESKYPVKVFGVVLFNAFSNAGVVDNPDLPSVAFPRVPGASHGSVGASVRQTVLGLRFTGPHVWGAKTAAELTADFFGGLSYEYYGSSTATPRLRTGDVSLAWRRDAIHAGVASPLISPLSPSSYATVGIPALGWAGNLWTWSPQARYEHRFALSNRSSVDVEAGLLDPAVVGVQQESPARKLSAGELARRPGSEARIAYRINAFGREMVLGGGGYRGRESFADGVKIGTWALTSDWQIPLARWAQVNGEFYRGVGLGALGGGAYKDVLTGADPVTGLNRTIGLNAMGGWSQVKLRFGDLVEANAAMGVDAGYARDLRTLVLSSATNPLELAARTSMVFGNVIYRPKTYLIVSPEYRRIMNWQITGPATTANIFTLSLGYQF